MPVMGTSGMAGTNPHKGPLLVMTFGGCQWF